MTVPNETQLTRAEADGGDVRPKEPAGDGSSHPHMLASRGRIVQTPRSEKPYKVVLEHEERGDTEHPVSTMREGEALIRQETPRPAKPDTSREHQGG